MDNEKEFHIIRPSQDNYFSDSDEFDLEEESDESDDDGRSKKKKSLKPKSNETKKQLKSKNKHVQSTKVDLLTQDVQRMMDTLSSRGIYFDLPDDVMETEQRPISYRQQHTKGNTKNQRKKVKQQQIRLLEAAAEHLHVLMVQNSLK